MRKYYYLKEESEGWYLKHGSFPEFIMESRFKNLPEVLTMLSISQYKYEGMTISGQYLVSKEEMKTL